MRVETLYEPSETIADIKNKWLVVGLGLMVCGYGTVLADEAVSQALQGEPATELIVMNRWVPVLQ